MRTVAIIVLLALVTLTASIPVRAAPSAIIVYDYGLAKGVRWTFNGHVTPINKTSSFTQDDQGVYAYVEAAFYTANVTWAWYDPTGQLYGNKTNMELQCTTSPCYFVSFLPIVYNPPATNFGRWRVELWTGNVRLFTDYFYISPVLTQDNNWSFRVDESATVKIAGTLTVTIHPNNGTWSFYQIYMPYASNVTAVNLGSGKVLTVVRSNDGAGRVIVYLGGPRPSGYSFVIRFDVTYGQGNLNGLAAGGYVFTWQEYPWQRSYDPHPIYETFNITLPKGATFVDLIGRNNMSLTYGISGGEQLTIRLDDTILSRPFGWTIIYRDPMQRNFLPTTQTPPTEPTGLTAVSAQAIPILPLTLGGLNVWSALMSVLMLIGSELASPLYGRTGSRLVINRRRLRIAALLLVTIFLATTAYQFLATLNTVTR